MSTARNSWACGNLGMSGLARVSAGPACVAMMLALAAGSAWGEPPTEEGGTPAAQSTESTKAGEDNSKNQETKSGETRSGEIKSGENTSDAAPLGGPKVGTAEAKKTLVERDFDGALKMLEGSPEEAAIDLLTLDAETKAKVDKVFAERAAFMDKFTMENLDLIQALAGARQSGDMAAARKMLREALPKLGDVAKQERLKTQIALVLPSERAAEFTTLVDDYYAALVSDQQRQLGKGGEKVSWLQATVRVHLQQLGGEIKRSFYRQVGDGQARLEKLITTLGLNPEQESKVRKIVQDYAIENKFKMKGPKVGKLIADVMAELEPDQRRTLIQELLKERESERDGGGGEGKRGDAEGAEMRGEGSGEKKSEEAGSVEMSGGR